MTHYDRVEKVSNFLKNKINFIPEIAIVLGSGLGKFADEIEDRIEVPYEEIPLFPKSTVEGHVGKMIFGKIAGKYVVAMQGRFHLYEGYDVLDVTLHVRVFKMLGVEKLIVTNAAGAINFDFKVGDLMIIKDHLSLFSPSPLMGANDERFGTRFPSMGEAYDREMIAIAHEIAKENGIRVQEGVYSYCQGPMFETPAEIRALRGMGADAAGMSTVPEVIVAVHSGIKVLGISCMTNMASGILDIPLTHAEVMETGKQIEKSFSKYVREIIAKL